MTSDGPPAHAPAPLPADEAVRLQVLQSLDLLDTLPETAYDDLVGLAGDICGVPIAAISLLDTDRQWFKSLVGLNVTQTPRDVSFCAHTILVPDQVLVVDDASLDRRFASNPLVASDPSIRFYAGMPLVIDAQPVGALCVIDTQPRTLSGRQLESLSALGRQVSAQFDLRRQLTALARVEQEVRLSEQRYRHLSMHDTLTGVGNRAFLNQHLAALAGRSCGVLYVDLDGFKAVNDELGHEAGDGLLIELAARVRHQLTPAEVVARVGGDEFVIVQSPSSPHALSALRTRLVAELTRAVPHESGLLRVGASIGQARRDEGARATGEELLHDADTRMYKAKAAGRRRRPAHEDVTRAAELRQALEAGAIRPAYQLIWELVDSNDPARARVHGAEALARWDRDGVEVQPASFINDVDRFGLLSDLGAAILRSALVDVGRWQQHARLSEDFRVHVNIGAAQLHTGELPGLLTCLTDELGVGLARICVEVTETGLLDDVAFSPAEAAHLRELGVALALDDFGTGYSSLTQLRAYPFDTLKIDRTFVADLERSSRARDIVTTVIDLAARLGISAVAEGVEDLEQLRVLRELGCTRFQGFLFDRPGSATSALDTITRNEPAVLPLPRLAAAR